MIGDREPLPGVSVVVTTYNRRDLLPDVIAPVLADEAASEVIVVVDGSTDGSLDYLRTLAATNPRLRPVFIANAGKERARQQGLDHVREDVVLLLDDDVVAEPGLVTGHALAQRRLDHRVVVGYMPVALPVRRRPGQAATFLYAEEYERRADEYEADPGLTLTKLWGGNVSLPTADARRVGLVSPAFGHGYHQDRDFGLRALRAGLKGHFDRRLSAEHRHSRSLQQLVRDARSQGAARVHIHRAYSGTVGPSDPDEFAHGLPRPLRAWVRLCRGEAAGRASGQMVLQAARLSGWLRFYGLETLLTRLLRRIEQQRGAAAYARAC